MSDATFRYTELAAKARTNAMNEVRDYADSEFTKYQTQLDEARAESYLPNIDGMALGRKTTAISHKLNDAITFKKTTDDDMKLLTFLQKNTFEFLETGELVAATAELPERQALDFDQYKGAWYNSYTAESEDFTYKITKMHTDRMYTIHIIAKDGSESDSSSEEVGSVGHAMRVLQARHTAHLKAKSEQGEVA